MALYYIPDAGPTRGNTINIPCGTIVTRFGDVRMFGPCPHYFNNIISTGGSWMEALLGPDLGYGQQATNKTDGTSLQPLIGLLRLHSPKGNWVAGHLLNGGLGGSGTLHENLTPLTHKANMAHETFEKHIKDILYKSYTFDSNRKKWDFWYCVEYNVTVSKTPYYRYRVRSHEELHRYAYSHITLNYRIVRLVKSDYYHQRIRIIPIKRLSGDEMHDPLLQQLLNLPIPNFHQSNNIKYFEEANNIEFSVEIHNEDVKSNF